MLRVTDDILELRCWAEERGASPCRSIDGRIGLCFEGDPSPALRVGWDELEPVFVAGRRVFVCDDGPGCRTWFIGSAEEARDYVARADPWLRGAATPDAIG